MNWKEFFKPDSKKLCIFFVVICISLAIASHLFFNEKMRMFLMSAKYVSIFARLQTIELSDLSDLEKEEKITEITEELDGFNSQISSSSKRFNTENSVLNFLYPRNSLYCLIDSELLGVISSYPIITVECEFTSVLVVVRTMIIFYLISCLIVWVYERVHKKGLETKEDLFLKEWIEESSGSDEKPK